MEGIGNRICELIDLLGIKKTELAREIKISDPSVSRICSGKTNPSKQTIAMICRAYNVNEEWLRNGTGEVFANQSKEEALAKISKEILGDDHPLRFFLVKALAEMSTVQMELLTDFVVKVARELAPEEKVDKS